MSVLQIFFLAWVVLIAGWANAQTNQPTNAVSAPQQIWDYAEQLQFAATQKATMEKLRHEYEAARTELRKLNEAELPPDVKQATRIQVGKKLTALNRQIGELLSTEQEKQFAELRETQRKKTLGRVREVSAAPENNQSKSDPDPEDVSHFTRLPPRAELADEEYRKLAAELRVAYSKEPKQWPAPAIDETVRPYFKELGLLPTVQYPTNNPYSEAKAQLGKKLFFDPRISGSAQIACASCHDAELGWGDGRTISFGHSRKALKRNSPTLLNIGHSPTLFWDGRASSLEEQVVEVINNADEMQSGAAVVQERLSGIQAYTNEFAKVFGSPEITLAKVAKSIATFERTITSRSNPFDAFLTGETNSLSDSAVRGLHLFRTTARCINCHQGPNLTDNRFHDEGLSYFGRKLQDLGRYEVTKDPKEVGAFKTPSLRNIARTAPYMHNGLFDLDGVLNLYNAGMPTLRPKPDQKDNPLFPTKSPLLQPLGLNKRDLQDLRAFLESLTETRHRVPPPELPVEVSKKD